MKLFDVAKMRLIWILASSILLLPVQCKRSCPPCPSNALLDFVIALDSSSSVGDNNWVLMTTFVRNIIQQFNLGKDSARIGGFRYSSEVDTATEIPLNRFTNSRDDLVAAFNNIPHGGSGTRTGRALEYARDTFFRSANGNRPGVKNVLLIITGGRSQDPVAKPAKKLRQDGVSIFVLGVQPARGQLNMNQLNQIAGDPNRVFVASSFAKLHKLHKQITDAVCEVDSCAHDPRP